MFVIFYIPTLIIEVRNFASIIFITSISSIGLKYGLSMIVFNVRKGQVELPGQEKKKDLKGK